MLQNAYFLAKIGADTAENEQHFAEILPKTGKCRVVASARALGRFGGRARRPHDGPVAHAPGGLQRSPCFSRRGA